MAKAEWTAGTTVFQHIRAALPILGTEWEAAGNEQGGGSAPPVHRWNAGQAPDPGRQIHGAGRIPSTTVGAMAD